MKISDIKGEAALDAFADMIDPAMEIMTDPAISAAYKNPGTTMAQLVGLIIKSHKQSIIKIMAILDGEDPETYADKINILTVPEKLIEIINDPEMKSLFPSQGRRSVVAFSGSATGNTTEKEN